VTPRLLGGSPEEVPERYAAASPVHLPAPTVTPILLRGSEDEIVPATQAQAYRDAVGARIVPLTGAGHFDPIHPGTAAFDALLQALSPLAPTSESTP
jgi:pimeloyl-ACP methyl ester carboxylesterase